VFYSLDINIKYILEITYGRLQHIENLPNNFLKQKSSFKPNVAGFRVARTVLVSDLGSINLGHERAR
jgi:hypothetical protein